MTTLCDYTNDAITKALDDCGAFFAFGNKQFDERKQEGIKYVSMGAGLICPKDKTEEFNKSYDSALETGIALDLAENGKAGIIHRELSNHEFCITYDITDTVRALTGYGITGEEIRAETGEYMRQWNEWEESQEQEAMIEGARV